MALRVAASFGDHTHHAAGDQGRGGEILRSSGVPGYLPDAFAADLDMDARLQGGEVREAGGVALRVEASFVRLQFYLW